MKELAPDLITSSNKNGTAKTDSAWQLEFSVIEGEDKDVERLHRGLLGGTVLVLDYV